MTKPLKTHNFVVNPKDNGGESIVITTEFYDNGDGVPSGIYTNQKITLMSYGNSATIQLGSAALTPENLREFANQLEAAKPKTESISPKFKIGDRVVIRSDAKLVIWNIQEVVITKTGIVYVIDNEFGTRYNEQSLIKSNV